jgi:ligand-binding SRPBCC domain-containing protein
MDHELHTTLELPLPIDAVFPFFAEAGNLQRITPPELHFEILTPQPVEMRRGTLLEYRLGLFGVPFRWRTTIAAWDPPHGFVDVQLSGPYAVWEHTHVFAATEAGTLIDDRVRYRLPLSPLGDVAHPFVRRQLTRIFSYRQAAVRELLDGGRSTPPFGGD